MYCYMYLKASLVHANSAVHEKLCMHIQMMSIKVPVLPTLMFKSSLSVHVEGGLRYLVCVCLSVCLMHIFSDMVILHVERKVPRVSDFAIDASFKSCCILRKPPGLL